MKKKGNYVLIILISLFIASCGNSKKDFLVKKWKATELDLSGTKLTGEQVNVVYSFNTDGSFSRVEDGKSETGSWEYIDEEKKLILNLKEENIKAEKSVEELSENKLILSGEEFSMKQTLTFEPVAE